MLSKFSPGGAMMVTGGFFKALCGALAYLAAGLGLSMTPDNAADIATLLVLAGGAWLHTRPNGDLIVSRIHEAAAPLVATIAEAAPKVVLILALIVPLFMLGGCAGSSVKDLATALANDQADVCVTVNNAFPPYAGSATLCRSNSKDGGTVTVDKNGVTTISRNGQKAAAP